MTELTIRKVSLTDGPSGSYQYVFEYVAADFMVEATFSSFIATKGTTDSKGLKNDDAMARERVIELCRAIVDTSNNG